MDYIDSKCQSSQRKFNLIDPITLDYLVRSSKDHPELTGSDFM